MAPALRGWSLGLNAAWARGDNAVIHQPLLSIEPFKATATVDYEPSAAWGVRLAATVVAAKDRLPAGTAPLFRTDGYFVLDAFVHFALGERGRLDVGVSNLTDENYIDWIDVRGRAADDPLVPYAAHPGMNVSAAVSWTF